MIFILALVAIGGLFIGVGLSWGIIVEQRERIERLDKTAIFYALLIMEQTDELNKHIEHIPTELKLEWATLAKDQKRRLRSSFIGIFSDKVEKLYLEA